MRLKPMAIAMITVFASSSLFAQEIGGKQRPLPLPMKHYLKGNFKAALALFQRERMFEERNPTPYFYMGNIYYDLGQYQLAKQYYEQALKQAPDNPELLIAMGNTLKQLGKPADALFFYTLPDVENALKQREELKALFLSVANVVKASFDRGLSNFRQGKMVQGLSAMEKVLTWEPVAMADYYIALIQMRRGFLDEAEARLLKALSLDPNNIHLRIALGRLYLQKEEVDKALAEFRKVVPEDASQFYLVPQEAFVGLGHAQLEQGKLKLKEILPIYLQATRRDSLRLPFHYRWGMIYLRTGLLDDAVFHFQKAIEADGLHTPSYLYMGVALYRKAQEKEASTRERTAATTGELSAEELYNQAIFFLQRALQLYPFSSLAHLYLGQAYLKQNKNMQAVLALRKAQALASRSADVRLYLGIALSRFNLPVYAVRELLAAVRLNPKSALAHFSLGMAYRQLGMAQEAVGELLTAHRLKTSDQNILFALSSTYMVVGDTKRARIFLKKALRLEPDYIQSLMDEAVALYQQGLLTSAITTYKRILAVAPDNARALYALGFVYFVKGNKSKALSFLQMGLKTDSTLPVAPTARYIVEGIKQGRPI